MLLWLGLVAVHWLQVAVACQPEPRSWAWLVRLDGPSLAWRALRQLVLVFMRNHKNKETADKLLLERQNVEVLIRKFNAKNAEVAALTEATQTQIDGVQRANAAVTGADYSQFSHEEKMQAGLLVNMTLTLAQMINKELELDD